MSLLWLSLLGCVDLADRVSTDTGTFPAGEDPPYRSPGLLLGAYSPRYLGTSERVEQQLTSWDALVPQRLTLGGVFVGVEDPDPTNDIPGVFRSLTDAGYTPFVNLVSERTMAELARGDLDEPLSEIALAFAAWTEDHPDTAIFLAPTPEMNGDWETYGGDPDGYKQFLARLQGLFAGAGVPDGAVRWVFAPNGWSEPGGEFERYYPGDDRVDAVGFSAYQWGGCLPETSWDAPAEVYGPYLDRMAHIAPSKPLFVTQTAASSVVAGDVANPVRKGEFLAEAYRTLAARDQVLGVLYFNIDKECDWAVFRDGVLSFGYDDAAATAGTTYLAPPELADLLR